MGINVSEKCGKRVKLSTLLENASGSDETDKLGTRYICMASRIVAPKREKEIFYPRTDIPTRRRRDRHLS